MHQKLILIELQALMEGTLGEKDNDTKIAYNEIYTPEYKYKKSIDLSSPNNEINNKMKKTKSRKLSTILKKESRVYLGLNKKGKKVFSGKKISEFNQKTEP